MKIKKGTKIYFTNHAGKQVAEYIREIKNGEYTDLICYLNGFKEETKIECFRYCGVIQEKYSASTPTLDEQIREIVEKVVVDLDRLDDGAIFNGINALNHLFHSKLLEVVPKKQGKSVFHYDRGWDACVDAILTKIKGGI